MELAHKLFSTRGGTIALGALAAILAGVAVFIYVRNYRSSVNAGGTTATVLVAKSLIPKGTPGRVIASQHLFQATTISESQLRDGAVSDPSALVGKVAADDIYPAQQLTLADFAGVPNTVAAELSGRERAITLPLDPARGLIGDIRSGDRVDVYAGFNVIPVDATGGPVANGSPTRALLRLIMQNIPVLNVGKKQSGVGSSTTTNVMLRVTPAQSAKLAFASDNGKVWLVLRPPSGAGTSPPSVVTVETLLLGIPPVAALKSFGGR